jgi:hypothetical protein
MRQRTMLAPALALALGACGMTYQAYPTVPAPLAERVPVPPRTPVPLIWRPGHYDWNGTNFVWHAGEWVERAGHGTLWQDGYWRTAGSSYAWVPGHWM